MATDFAVAYFALPVLIGIVLLIGIALLGRKHVTTSDSFLGLGRGRLALGYLGSLAALLAYSFVESILHGRTKVELGHVTAAEASQHTPGWTLYLFILLTPFVVFFLSVLGLPALAVLRRLRFASVAGALITSQLIAALFSAWPAVFPHNQWCGSHRLDCVGGAYVSAALLSATVALGFSLAAWLPWIRSPSMQANNLFTPKPLRGSA